MYLTSMLITYIVQTTTKMWIARAHAAGMRQFYETFSFYNMFNRMGHVYEVWLRKGNGYATKPQSVDLAEATGHVHKKEEVAAEMYNRSEVVDETLQYVSCLYPERANRELRNNARHTEYKN